MSSPTYTYTPNIPQAAQERRVTQPGIESNFEAINELINVNHIGFSDSVNYGKHNFTSLPQQGSDPTTSSTDIALYTKAASTSNGIEIFYRYPNNGTVNQLTGGGTTGSGASTNGYSYLTTTLLMKWGLATINTTGSTTVSFPTGGIPAFTSVCNFVQYTPAANYTLNTNGPWISSFNTTSFVFNAPSGQTFCNQIYWFAIGI